MNPLKKLLGQTAVYGLSTIVGRFLNYLLVPLYTYRFSTAEYGVVTELFAYVTFLSVFLTYGMETAFFRFSEKREDKDTVYSTSLISLTVSSVLFLIVGYLLSGKIAHLIEYYRHPEYVKWFVFIIAFDTLTAIPFARLRQQNNAKRFAFIKLVNIGINIGLNLFFILVCPRIFGKEANLIYNPSIGVGYIFISLLIASFITALMLLPNVLKIKWTFNRTLFKEMMVYALPLLVAGLAGMVNETFDRILLKYFLPDNINKLSQIGIYGACYKIAVIMTIFIQTFRYAAEPFFFSHAKKDNAKSTYANVMKYFVIVCSFIFLATMLNMDIVKGFVGPAYREGLHIAPILLLANLFLGVFMNLSIWYKLSGNTGYGALLTIIGAIITIVLNIWWIPIFGYTGASWATLVCYFLITVLSYIIGQRKYPINYDLKSMFLYLSLALALYFGSKLMNIEKEGLRLVLNNLLIVVFIIIAIVSEKNKFLKISNEN